MKMMILLSSCITFFLFTLTVQAAVVPTEGITVKYVQEKQMKHGSRMKRSPVFGIFSRDNAMDSREIFKPIGGRRNLFKSRRTLIPAMILNRKREHGIVDSIENDVSNVHTFLTNSRRTRRVSSSRRFFNRFTKADDDRFKRFIKSAY